MEERKKDLIVVWDPTGKGGPELDSLAERLSLPVHLGAELPSATTLAVQIENNKVSLAAQGMRIQSEFTSGPFMTRLKTVGKSHPLIKAIGTLREPEYVFDGTGGLGIDTVSMAWKGYRLVSCEKNPIVFELSQSAWREFVLKYPEKIATMKVDWILRDSKAYLLGLKKTDRPEVIYLDPMFPEKKKSALPKKEMQLLRRLLGDQKDRDEDLFEVGLKTAKKRVVVKRSPDDDYIGAKPNHSVGSKLVRFDVYIC